MSRPKRFETNFGNIGVETSVDGSVIYERLIPFCATYLFLCSKWSITVWAKDWEAAQKYCDNHNLILEGQIDSIL